MNVLGLSFFYHDSSTLKLQESNLGETIQQAITIENAIGLLNP